MHSHRSGRRYAKLGRAGTRALLRHPSAGGLQRHDCEAALPIKGWQGKLPLRLL